MNTVRAGLIPSSCEKSGPKRVETDAAHVESSLVELLDVEICSALRLVCVTHLLPDALADLVGLYEPRCSRSYLIARRMIGTKAKRHIAQNPMPTTNAKASPVTSPTTTATAPKTADMTTLAIEPNLPYGLIGPCGSVMFTDPVSTKTMNPALIAP